MSRRLFFSVLIASLALSYVFAASSAPPSDSSAAVSAELKDIEHKWLDAEKNRDAATFENMVTDDWIAITPDGKRQTKAERAANIKASHIDSATLGDMDVRVYGDTAIVTGTDDESYTRNGQAFTGHYAWTDVFIRRNGKWLAVASQTAQVK